MSWGHYKRDLALEDAFPSKEPSRARLENVPRKHKSRRDQQLPIDAFTSQGNRGAQNRICKSPYMCPQEKEPNLNNCSPRKYGAVSWQCLVSKNAPVLLLLLSSLLQFWWIQE